MSCTCSSPPPRRIYTPRAWDVLAVLVLIAAGMRVTALYPQKMDVALQDETKYLAEGLLLRTDGLPCPECSPWYSLWYWVLSRLQPEPLSLFYLNWRLMTLGLALATYAMARLFCSPLPAFLLATLWLFARINVASSTRVDFFAIIVASSLLLATARASRWVRVLPAAVWAAVVDSYVRPELFITAIVLFGASVAGVFLEGEPVRRRSAIRDIGLALMLSGVLVADMGLPFRPRGGSRIVIAFGQGFSRRWVRWTGSSLDPWTDWRTIIRTNFGGPVTVLGAARKAPRLFLRHVAENVRGLPAGLRRTVWDTLRPGQPEGPGYADAAGALVLGIFAMIWRKRWLPALRRAEPRRRLLAAVLLAFGLPGFAVGAFIFPDPRFLLLPAWSLSVALVGLLASWFESRHRHPPRVALVILAPAAILCAPLVHAGYMEAEPRTALAEVAHLRSLGITSQVYFLEGDGGIGTYAGPAFVRVPPADKALPFGEFLKTAHIGVVIVSSDLLKHPAYVADPEWHRFLEDPQHFGFVDVSSPLRSRVVLVRRELLAPAPSAGGAPRFRDGSGAREHRDRETADGP